MLNSVNQVKSEVLYEKVFRVLRMYTDYLKQTTEPLESAKAIYNEISAYPDKVVLCNDDKEFAKLETTIRACESFIKALSQPTQVTA